MMAAKKKIEVSTSIAFLIWAFLLTGGFMFTGFKPAAQFWAYAMFLTLGLGTYTGKRLIQKRPNFMGAGLKKTLTDKIVDES